MNELKLFTLHLKPGNAHKQRGFRGVKSQRQLFTHSSPLFTLLYIRAKRMIIINLKIYT